MKGLVWRAILRLYIDIFWLFNGLPLHQSAIIRPKMPLYASQSWILPKKTWFKTLQGGALPATSW